MKMTLEIELTPENLEKLKAFCQETGAAEKPKKQKAAPKPEPEAPTEEVPFKEEAPAKKVTMTDVRAVALKLSKAGQRAKLKELFTKYGAEKLSGVKEEDYATLLEDLNNVGV